MRTFSQAVDTEEDIEKYLKIRPAGQESNLGTSRVGRRISTTEPRHSVGWDAI
jgi:hypothetical protein